MRRHQIQYTYVMPYGRVPMIGGNVYLETGKTVAKKAIPMLAKLWSKLSDEQKAQVITAGVTLGAKGAQKLGSVVRSGVQSLSQKAEDKLSGLLGRKPSKKVSKKAQKMLKKMVKEKQPKVKLPTGFKNQLTKSQQNQLTKGGEQILSNLLYGRGLAIMN